MIEFINADCMVEMAKYPDKYFDLAIVDPPYNIYQNAHRTLGSSKLAKTKYYDLSFDEKPMEESYFIELFRVSKNQIIWGGNHLMHLIKRSSPCWIVWDKNNSGGFADCELAYTSFGTAVRKFKWTWNGMLQENMKQKQIRIHPNEKPIQLYQWLLQNYAERGMKILDTHGGSMSHAIACDKENFDLVIIEDNKTTFDTAVNRFNQYKSQIQLFQ